jgi:WD40 repeat protein/uncharacterized protein YraI
MMRRGQKRSYGEPQDSSINVFLIAVVLAGVVLVCLLLYTLLSPALLGGEDKPKYEVIPYGSDATATPAGMTTPVPTWTPMLTAPPSPAPTLPAPTPTLAAQPVKIIPGNAATLQQITALPGHSSPVSSVSFSPDGLWLASGDWSGLIKLWNARTGIEIYTFRSASNRVDSIAFSADNTRLAAAGQDNLVRWWVLAENRELPTLGGPAAAINALTFSAQGGLIAAASDDGKVYLWDVATGAARPPLVGHTSYVTSLAFSPDGTVLAAGGEDDTIRLWSVADGASLGVLAGHTSAVASVAFAPDGLHLVSAGADRAVRLWDLVSMTQQLQFSGHTENVNTVTFSPDGSLVVSGAGGIEDNTVRVWDARSGAQLAVLYSEGPVNAVAFSPDGSRLAVGGATYLTVWAASGAAPGQTTQARPVSPTPTITPPVQTPTGEPCYLTVRVNDANLRGGPGADYAVLNRLALNQNVQSDGWAFGDEGYVWWRAVGGGWARSDVFVDAANPDLPASCWQLAELDDIPATPATLASAAPAANTPAPGATAQPCALVTQLDEVNVRTGPGTSYNTVNQLTQNQTLQAAAWAFDADGFVWWRLSTGGWVRADTVKFPESCLTLPQVQP